MKNFIFKHVLFFVSVFALLSFDLPEAWFVAGSKPQCYEMGLVKESSQNGKMSATIKSIKKRIGGFGTLMQQVYPDKFLGKRIRMSAYVKSENVKDWSGLWLRVDQAGSNNPLSFDNMQKRAIMGTTDWKKYEIVLDVPTDASLIAFGALLSGTGQIWFDSFSFEIVDASVPTTGFSDPKEKYTQLEPANLDFEE